MLIAAWGVALLFCLVVSASLFGYIFCFASYLKNQPYYISYPLGFGFSLSLIFLVGIFGGYTPFIQGIILVLGFMFFIFRCKKITLPPIELEKKDWIWILLPLVYFITRFFSAGLPQQHSDPLYYHLAAPKLWVELGQIKLTEEHPSFVQATLWESLYGFPLLFLGAKGWFNHVVTHVYAQWMHVFWGQIASLVLARALLQKFFQNKLSFNKAFFVSWLCLCLPCHEWTGGLAKNDFILCLLIFSSLLSILDKRFFIGGLLVGLAFSTKFLAFWFFCGALVFIPYKKFHLYFLGVFLGFLPVLLRNFLNTGDPLFPIFDSTLGPHWISSWWNDHNASFIGEPKFQLEMFTAWIFNQLFIKPLPKILLILSFLGLLIKNLKNKNIQYRSMSMRHNILNTLGIQWAAFFLIQLILLLLILRPTTDGRYGNYVGVIFLLFGIACFIYAFDTNSFFKKAAFFSLFLLGFFVNSPIDLLWKIPRDYWFYPANKYVEQFHYNQKIKDWINEHIKSSVPILPLSDKMNFYLEHSFETVSEMRKWENIIADSTNGFTGHKSDTIQGDTRLLFSKIRERNYQYVYIDLAYIYPSSIRPFWDQLLALKSQAIFQADTGMVLDLFKASQ